MATNEGRLIAASVLRYLVDSVPGTKRWDAYTAMLELENYLLSVGVDCTLEDLIYPVLTEVSGGVNEANVDRDALLALADRIERKADDFDATVGDVPMVHAGYLTAYAERIREACGVTADE